MKQMLAAIGLIVFAAIALARGTVVHPVANLSVDVPAAWSGYAASCTLHTPLGSVLSAPANSVGSCYFGYVTQAGTYSVVAHQLNQFSQSTGISSAETISLPALSTGEATPAIVVVLE
jgi:hypothetical protein